MLILICGDFHITGKNPISRLDDLTETQFLKLNEIKDFANKHNCPIVSVGDFFHVPIIANSILNRVGEILNQLDNPWYTCWGNHDTLYHSVELANRTSLGVLLTNHPKIKHITKFKNDYGVSFDYTDWDTPTKENNSKFLLSHKAIISEKQSKSNFWIEKDETFAKQVGKWSDKYKIIICGHWHISYRFKHNKTLIINSGPINRLTIEDNLQPSVVLLNLETGIFKRHYLESAKPFDEIISAKHIIRKENNSENIKKFISAINKKRSNYDSAFMDYLMEIVDNHELDKDMEELLVNILAKTKERKNK